MRRPARFLSLSLLSIALLTACSDSDTSGGTGPTPPSGSVTVTPSLGKVFDAAVEVRCAATGTTLGSGVIGATGSIALTLTGSCTGPVIIELLASGTSTYFDEQSNAVTSLPSGTQLRSVLPSLAADTGTIAITPLTEIDFQQALAARGNVGSELTD